jgi:hypothetical protein
VVAYYSGWLEPFKSQFAGEMAARGAVPLVQIDSTISVVRRFTNDPVLVTETAVAPAAGKAAKIPELFSGARSAGVLGVLWFDVVRLQRGQACAEPITTAGT